MISKKSVGEIFNLMLKSKKFIDGFLVNYLILGEIWINLYYRKMECMLQKGGWRFNRLIKQINKYN